MRSGPCPDRIALDQRIVPAIIPVGVIRMQGLIGGAETGARKIVLVPIRIDQRQTTDIVEAGQLVFGQHQIHGTEITLELFHPAAADNQ